MACTAYNPCFNAPGGCMCVRAMLFGCRCLYRFDTPRRAIRGFTSGDKWLQMLLLSTAACPRKRQSFFFSNSFPIRVAIINRYSCPRHLYWSKKIPNILYLHYCSRVFPATPSILSDMFDFVDTGSSWEKDSNLPSASKQFV